jgi:hypothetical protein
VRGAKPRQNPGRIGRSHPEWLLVLHQQSRSNMEVKDANSALLSNYEVFQLLTDLKEQRKVGRISTVLAKRI